MTERCNCGACPPMPDEMTHEDKLKALAFAKKMKDFKKFIEDDAEKNGEPSFEKIAQQQAEYFPKIFKEAGFDENSDRDKNFFHILVSETLAAFSIGGEINIEKMEKDLANDRANLN